MAGKKMRNKEKSARYTANKNKKDGAKITKEKATRERWAKDKDYLAKQAEKGYVKVNKKWIRQPKQEVTNA